MSAYPATLLAFQTVMRIRGSVPLGKDPDPVKIESFLLITFVKLHYIYIIFNDKKS
jgi:hypothetical protein